jgi:Flp pilus assembly protein TadB
VIAVVLGFLAAALVLWPALLSTRSSSRFRELPRRNREPERAVAPRFPGGMLTRLGQRAGAMPGFRRLSIPPSDFRFFGSALVVIVLLSVVSVRLAVVLGAVLVGFVVLRSRRAVRRRKRAIARDIPMITDLLNLAAQSGLTVGASLASVSNVVDSPVCDVFRDSVRELGRGMRMTAVLELCEQRLGDDGLALMSALQSAERYGSPLRETLAQLVHESRVDQERRAEQSARRLSVELLFPVAGCILPAFALLTVAPLLAGSFGTLADSFH